MEDFEQTPAPAEQEPIATETEAPEATETQEASEPAEAPRRSRREALENALRSVEGDKGDEKAEPKSDDAEKSDDSGPARGPDGKFVAKDDKEQPDTAKEKPEDGDKSGKQPETNGGHGEAPARFSADAKAAWKDAPEPVRAEAHRMMRELESGIQKKDEQLAPLKPYFDMAEKAGTRVQDAMARYVNMEHMLRQDPAQGFRHLAQNMGISPQEVAQMLTGQQQEGQPDPRDRQIAQMGQQISQLRQQLGGVSQSMQSQQETQIHQQVEAFASQHTRFDELAEEITQLLETGYATSLEDAYEKAERLNPAPQPEPEPAPAPPAQTREAKSVTGAPTSGSNPANRQPSKTRTEALSRAFSRAGLS